jgi:hypothetical protein
MRVSIYHRFLRVSLLVMTAILLFDSGAISPVTKQLSDTTIIYVASVGSSVAANVAPNEFNTLSAEIAKQQELLNRREAELNEREIKARSFGSEEGTDYSIYIISAILFIIIVLLIVNYVLDFTRVRRYRYENTMG